MQVEERAAAEAARVEAEKERLAELEREELAKLRLQREHEKEAYRLELEKARDQKRKDEASVQNIMDALKVSRTEAEFLLKSQEDFRNQSPTVTTTSAPERLEVSNTNVLKPAVPASASDMEESRKIGEANAKQEQEIKDLDAQVAFFQEKLRVAREQAADLEKRKDALMNLQGIPSPPLTPTATETSVPDPGAGRRLHACVHPCMYAYMHILLCVFLFWASCLYRFLFLHQSLKMVSEHAFLIFQILVIYHACMIVCVFHLKIYHPKETQDMCCGV